MNSPFLLLAVQISFSFLALAVLVTRLLPWIRRLPPSLAQEGLLWVHVPRAIALGILAPGQASGVAQEVAVVIAWGDFASALLALGTLLALHFRTGSRRGLLLAFSAVSLADIVSALSLGLGAKVHEHHLGVSWFVLTLYVPVVCTAQLLLLASLRHTFSPVRNPENGGEPLSRAQSVPDALPPSVK